MSLFFIFKITSESIFNFNFNFKFIKMKKVTMLSILIIAFFFSATAQKLTAKNVPAIVIASFQKQYPGTTPGWEKEKDKYEANFKQNSKTMSALFLSDGKLVETELDIKPATLPAPVLTYLSSHYKGVKVKEAAVITKASGEITYEAEVNGKDLIFEKNGTLVK